jgi:hypothetical protein
MTTTPNTDDHDASVWWTATVYRAPEDSRPYPHDAQPAVATHLALLAMEGDAQLVIAQSRTPFPESMNSADLDSPHIKLDWDAASGLVVEMVRWVIEMSG